MEGLSRDFVKWRLRLACSCAHVFRWCWRVARVFVAHVRLYVVCVCVCIRMLCDLCLYVHVRVRSPRAMSRRDEWAESCEQTPGRQEKKDQGRWRRRIWVKCDTQYVRWVATTHVLGSESEPCSMRHLAQVLGRLMTEANKRSASREPLPCLILKIASLCAPRWALLHVRLKKEERFIHVCMYTYTLMSLTRCIQIQCSTCTPLSTCCIPESIPVVFGGAPASTRLQLCPKQHGGAPEIRCCTSPV